VEDLVVVFVPADTRSSTKCFGEPRLDLRHRKRGLKGAQEKGRAALVGEEKRLFG
jgi:hypothetical protein